MTATILVVEDDSAIRRGLADALKFHSYRVLEAPDGQAGLDLALASNPDLILLDILMPRMDGMQVLAKLRHAGSGTPVIFLTAKGQEEDRVRGLRLGADDYVVKPFSASELLARVEAVLRRAPERPQPLKLLTVAGRRIDFERREITLASGARAVLPDLESRVLLYLASNRGRVVTREELLQRVWGVDPRDMQTRAVDMAVARLREQLDDDPVTPAVIQTVRGKGYMFTQPKDHATT